MNLSDMLVTLAQTSEIEQPELFPFPFNMHIIFVCISTLFLAYQFYKDRKPYQLIMCIAIPLSLAIWLSESRTLFYGIGLAEAVLLLTAFITAIIFRKKEEPAKNNAAPAASEKIEANESSSNEKAIAEESASSEKAGSENTES